MLGRLLENEPLPSVQVNPVPPLADNLGLFRNPYDDFNNPVGGLLDILPLARNDDLEEGVPGTIVAANAADGDWNRMDRVVGYEVDNQMGYEVKNQVGYEVAEYAPPLYGDQYTQAYGQQTAAETNQVAHVLPEPGAARDQRNNETTKKG